MDNNQNNFQVEQNVGQVQMQPSDNQVEPKKGKGGKIVIIVIVVLLLACVGAFVAYKFLMPKSGKDDNKEADNTKLTTKYIWCGAGDSCRGYLEGEDHKGYDNEFGSYDCESPDSCYVEKVFKDERMVLYNDDKKIYIANVDTKERELVSKESMKKLGYEKVDLESTNLNNEDITEFQTLNEGESFLITTDYKGENKELNVTLENNAVYLVTVDSKEKLEVPSVKKVYVQSVDNTFERHIYILTNDGVIYEYQYFGVDAGDEVDESYFFNITSDYKYEKLYQWRVYVPGDGFIFTIIGETADGTKFLPKEYISYENVKMKFGSIIVSADNEFIDITGNTGWFEDTITDIYIKKDVVIDDVIFVLEGGYTYTFDYLN